MKILMTGRFDPEYNRTKIMIKGLRDLGADLQVYPYSRRRRVNRRKLREKIREVDRVLMPSFTHTDVPFIRRLCNKPLIFDPLISRYLSKVYDYQSVWKYSPRAYKNYLKDSRSLEKADIVIADTQMHMDYYHQKFHIPHAKIKYVPVGVITEDFFPLQQNPMHEKKLIAGFYGSFIPLHGIEVIIEAAENLKDDKDVLFRICGDGIQFQQMKALAEKKGLKNIIFPGYIPYPDLNREINNFDIALGIFGSSQKAKMVVPNKLFHYAAAARSVISMESKGVKEIFMHGKDIHLCSPTGKELAKAIEFLKNQEYRKKIGEEAARNIRQNYNEKKIGEMVLEILKKAM